MIDRAIDAASCLVRFHHLVLRQRLPVNDGGSIIGLGGEDAHQALHGDLSARNHTYEKEALASHPEVLTRIIDGVAKVLRTSLDDLRIWRGHTALPLDLLHGGDLGSMLELYTVVELEPLIGRGCLTFSDQHPIGEDADCAAGYLTEKADLRAALG